MTSLGALRRKTLAAALCGIAAAALSAHGGRAAAEEFYKGKTITMYISGSPGGGYDTYARLLAHYMGNHIPGHPGFVAKNHPGAGGIVLSNYLYEQAARDGTVISGMHSDAVTAAIAGKPAAHYKPAEFGWLGSVSQDVTVCVAWHTAGIKTFADVPKKHLLIGAVTSTPTETDPRLFNAIAGTNFKIVTGYPNTSAVNLAMERGEVNGICNGYSTVQTQLSPFLRDKKLDIFLQAGATKLPELGNVTYIYDLVKKPEDVAWLDYEVGRYLFGRPFLAPPGLPADRLKTLRDAFWATVHDKAFLADAKKKKLEVLLPVNGEAVQAQIAKLQKTPKAIIARSATLTGK